MSTADAKRRVGPGPLGPSRLFPGLGRIREAARRDKHVRFSALLHHVTVDLLRSSYAKLNPKASPGVDGVTWDAYADGLEERLAQLHKRIHCGTYRAQPARRAYIPKGDGKEQRPIGLPTAASYCTSYNTAWDLWIRDEFSTQARSFSSLSVLSVIQYGAPLFRLRASITPRSIQ